MLYCRLLYHYYNWRQDTTSDLILILALNATVIALSALAKMLLLDWEGISDGISDGISAAADSAASSASAAAAASPLLPLWRDVYSVMVLGFGENFPGESAPPLAQAFSVAVATAGLAAFALVLALVEQVGAGVGVWRAGFGAGACAARGCGRAWSRWVRGLRAIRVTGVPPGR